MMTFGKYLATELVGRGARTFVWRARPVSGGTPNVAVKQFAFSGVEPDEPNWDAQQFLSRVRIQKSVVAAGGRYWLPVYDLGMTEDSAWFATDLCTLNLQQFIDSRTTPEPRALLNLFGSIVKGLVELEQVRRRPHGNLKPSNVLLCGSDELELLKSPTSAREGRAKEAGFWAQIDALGEGEKAPHLDVPTTERDPKNARTAAQLQSAIEAGRVRLSDPGTTTVDGEPGDVFALGQILHALVLHRPFGSDDAWPLAPADGWRALGRKAAAWREMCSAMLAPSPSARPSLDEVARYLREFAPKKKRKFRKRYLLVPAAAGALALAGLAAVAIGASGARARFAEAREQWVEPLYRSLADPARRTRFMHDPDLAPVVIEIDRAHALGQDVSSGLSLAGFRRAREGVDQVERIRANLSATHWRRLGRLEQLRTIYAERDWRQPAGTLQEVVFDARPRAGVDLGRAIDRVQWLARVLDSQQPGADRDWKLLQDGCGRLTQTRDATLAAMAGSLQSMGASSVRLDDAGLSGLEALHSTADLADRVARSTRPDWPGEIDSERLAQETPGFDRSHPTRTDIEHWLAALPLYKVTRPQTLAQAESLRQQLNSTTDELKRSGVPDDQQARFEKDRQELLAQIDQFAQTRFVEKDVKDGAFAKSSGRIETQLEGLRSYTQPRSPAEWLASVPKLSVGSPTLAAAWESWRASRLKSLPADADGAQLATVRADVEAMRSGLTDIDRQFAAPPGDLRGAFADAARARRESEIATLLKTINPLSLRADIFRIVEASTRYDEWCRSLRQMSADFPIRKQFLTREDRPEARWAADAALWNDPGVRKAVGPDLARLSALRNVSGESRDELVSTASRADSPEVAFEAWRALGDAGVNPPWPRTPAELKTETDLRKRMEELVASVKDPAERKTPEELLKSQAAVRWRVAVEQARDEQALADAWAARSAFGIDLPALAPLSPRARFDLWLWRTRVSAAKGDDAAVRNDLEQLRAVAADWKDAPPPAASAAERIAALSRPEPFADQNPGETLAVLLPGASSPTEFRRVNVEGARPVYLATTDVSVGQMTQVVTAAAAWDEARKLPWPYRPGETDPRRGPRTWEWSAEQSPRFVPPQLWLTPEPENDFAPVLRAERFNRMLLSDSAGGAPSEQHPMQYVPAQSAVWFARLCGLRLPTSREWLAAFKEFETKTTPEQRNLRDRTWDLQRAYVLANRQTRFPDEGIFGYAADPAATGARASARREDDGTLYFRPVSSAGGTPFRHLVGNVAQFVCDAENVTSATHQQVAAFDPVQFARDVSGRVFVVGGSALSAPQMKVDRPVPVTRTDLGYSDVGFRLAFTAPARSLSERVNWEFAKQDYAWPSNP